MGMISNLWDGDKGTGINLTKCISEMANRAHLHGNDWNRTISIDTLDVKTTDSVGVKKRVDDLIKSGRTAVTEYFKWRDGDAEWSKRPN